MKILLSYSKDHFIPGEKENRHSASILARALWEVCNEIGETDYISWREAEDITGKSYDLLVGLPRGFRELKRHNKFKLTFCFPAIAESAHTKRVLQAEKQRLGCKLSDCFAPSGLAQLADKYLIIGNQFVKQTYLNAGVKEKDIYLFNYGSPYFKFRIKKKEGKTIFLHLATTLGLRKGFWWVVNDFIKAKLENSKLICMGKIQHGEKFWYQFARSIDHPDIEIRGFFDGTDEEYQQLLREPHFLFYPSLSEGQPGVVLEAMASGVIPILSIETGIDYFPFGAYMRGKTLDILRRAEGMPNDKYQNLQVDLYREVQGKFNIEKFKIRVKKAINENIL